MRTAVRFGGEEAEAYEQLNQRLERQCAEEQVAPPNNVYGTHSQQREKKVDNAKTK